MTGGEADLLVVFADAAEEGADDEYEDGGENQAAYDQIPGGEKADLEGIGGGCKVAFIAGTVNGFDPPVIGARLQLDGATRRGQACLSHARLQWEEVQVIFIYFQDIGDAAGVGDIGPGEGDKLGAEGAEPLLGW